MTRMFATALAKAERNDPTLSPVLRDSRGYALFPTVAFSTSDALTRFKAGNFAFDSRATAVALKSGAGANAKFTYGVAVFTMDESGLMFEASIGGQKFSCRPK